jgi:predicted metal-dependent hydrolase
MHGSLIEKFLVEKARWILEKLEYFSKIPSSAWVKGNEADYVKYKDAAHSLAVDRVAFFNKKYGFEFNAITIKNQKTRWGSCSRKGNLNFNYKVALLPQRFSDYIFVHELCHVGQFNHSKKFWALVERTIPDYRDIREELKTGKVS